MFDFEIVSLSTCLNKVNEIFPDYTSFLEFLKTYRILIFTLRKMYKKYY